MTTLQGQEIVVHVFVDADGVEADRSWLRDLWRTCSTRFAIDGAVGTYEREPTDDLGDPSTAVSVLAALESAGTGVHQLLLRRVQDVVVLSLVSAPQATGPDTWEALERKWDSVVQPATRGVIGSARILQARLVDPMATPDPIALAPTIATATGTKREAVSTAARSWIDTGVVRLAGGLGPFAMWEATDPPNDLTVWDRRPDRRIVVIAGADRDDPLSAWTWSRGTEELTPFTNHLLNAAKVRYELRVRSAVAGRDLRTQADAAIASLLRLSGDVATSDAREPDARALLASSAPVISLQAGTLGLVDRVSRLREMRRTVEIAGRNMAAHARAEAPAGLFADDADVADWAARQIDDDATYLDAVVERARDVTALSDQLIERGLQARRERFNLGLTGIIGAILMALAAMQSLKLEFTLPRPLLGGVVTGLGALALLVPAVLLRIGTPGRTWPAVLVGVAAAAVASSVPWIVLTAASAVPGSASDVPTVVGASVLASVAGAGLGWWAARPRRRTSSSTRETAASVS